jgi:PAS domain S-box-containing protein
MPAASNPRAPSGRVPRMNAETSIGNIHVLLISPNVDQRNELQGHLDAPEMQIFRLIWASDFKAGIESLAQKAFQIVILDVEDSKDLGSLRSLMKNFPDVPLIVLTNITEPSWHQFLLREGAQDFLCQGEIDQAVLSRSLSYTIERHSAQRELRASEGRFRSMVERNADGIIIVDRAQKVQFMNPAAEELLGWTQDELLGQIFEVPLNTNLSQSQTEVRLQHRNGNPVYAEFRFVAIEWGGDPAYMLSLRDIRDRQEMEESHSRLAAILEETADFVAIADLKGRFLWVNRAGRKLVGMKAHEPSKKYILKDVVPAKTYKLLERVGLPTARSEGLWQGEAAVLNGENEIPVSLQIQAHKNQAGEIKYYSTVSRDISDRIAAKEELESQARILRSILNSMGDGVIVADATGSHLHWNPQAEALIGAQVKESEPSRWSRDYGIFHPKTGKPFPFFDLPLYKAIQGEASDQVEMLIRQQSGAEVIISTTGRGLTGAGGKHEGGVVVFRDITDKMRASETLERYSSALEQKNQELQDFAYVASHDLKAPLRAIRQLSQWLKEDLGDQLPAESERLIDLMNSRVKRMQGLLDDILRYARAGHGEMPIEQLDTPQIIREICDLLGMSDKFVVQLSEDLPIFESARGPFEQVFRNLIGNAVKHHDRESGCINISVREHNDTFDFVVEDDGPGIPNEFHERVFKMFQTLKPRDTVDGSGMGLALVQKLVNTCGGSIKLESVGRGTTITVAWPKQRKSEAE